MSSEPAGSVLRAQLPASLTAPRRARAAVRYALSVWGLDALTSDAELLTSELVANAAEHGSGKPIDLTIRRHTAPTGQRGILCAISDTSPALPSTQPTRADSERGRGLQIVAALATSSGVASGPDGKTAWFTLTTAADPAPAARHTEPEMEAGA